MDYLHISATVILRHGPALPPGTDSFELHRTEELQIIYDRAAGPIRRTIRTEGAPGEGTERVDPPGVLRVFRKIPWRLDADDVQSIGGVRVTLEELDAIDQYVSHTIRTAMTAFEACTDSSVEVWGSGGTRAFWGHPNGNEYVPIGGRAELEAHTVTEIGATERDRFATLLPVLSHPANDVVAAAFAVSRLQIDNFSPSARVVFAWSFLERLVKRLTDRKLKHHEVRDFAVQACIDDLTREPHPSLDATAVTEAVKQAYVLRNGLAHGEPPLRVKLDFHAFAHAVVLLARRLR